MAEPLHPILRDRDVDFLLYEVLRVEELCGLSYFADHSRETFDLYLGSVRRLAREVLFPAYKPMDEVPPRLQDGRVCVHPLMKTLYPRLVEVGVLSASRPAEVGGQQLPLAVATLAHAYLMGANLSAYGYVGLTSGAAHLLEVFGDADLQEAFMGPLYRGEWTGTMALTEPQAGSSVSDIRTRAIPRGEGTYTLEGDKIFISGGDHDLTDNIVHMTLARIEGAPQGMKGVSLFAVPKKRKEGDVLVDNDVVVAGLLHKIGWRGLPSLVLKFGERGDCRGYLVGPPHQGIRCMFQMMNEARLMVGVNAVATAYGAYLESLAYARSRPQGRPLASKDPSVSQVPILQHADVRRMLLRQKAIAEGGLALAGITGRYADVAHHGDTPAERQKAALLLDLLTPIAKTFPAEYGFEANALAVQVLGGYGYCSEYLPEAWLRDQKLNSIHEGTTGIQSIDLLSRRVAVENGAPLKLLREEVMGTVAMAKGSRGNEAWAHELEAALGTLERVTAHLLTLGGGGEQDAMLRHSVDYLHLTSIVVVAWCWLRQAVAASEGLIRNPQGEDADFYQGKRAAAQYWFATEVPRKEHLAHLCLSGEDSYARAEDPWF